MITKMRREEIEKDDCAICYVVACFVVPFFLSSYDVLCFHNSSTFSILKEKLGIATMQTFPHKLSLVCCLHIIVSER